MEFPKHNQGDHVREDQAVVRKNRVHRMQMPGIKTLHTRPLPEIAASLAAAMRSVPDVQEVRYVVGEYIEITQKDVE